ncbi:ABC transporter permease [Paenibacillus mucilaginosus]|uniref:Binding-protein-dependent transport systems inner membrane component n=3 Tax=Paenibacillus mucilaginosus TaxID=61624 RepID=H6NEG4_9BACL|nr:ABC transporter permease subunit [Paenibacillus mucilaginosus]AEI42323.1 binding-protein-dependent transport systems inner membrane component [Paenibacillus mucilaginosus KNP414]AFC28107.1 binding-protein-dependent transport systems inner membrane component [Paenibacillus mucilaginosus 3016]AFH60275.1 protein lplB [Paenibacillus mucilaginosus K02]MCG7214279.1 ABC transporter permease subunit [Paenibacillus mucilaginosus]WDM28788.1 sugar ABC transporter permease [Paenibacillus mucilaginosus]
MAKYWQNAKKHWMLYLMILPGIAYYIVFKYVPVAGSIIAFQKYQIMRGIWDSPWVGLDNFKFIFAYPDFYNVLRNTLLLAMYHLVFGFPAPILLALLFNEVRLALAKKLFQSLFYLPHFLSWVVVGGIVFELLSAQGIANMIRGWFGLSPILFMQEESMFRSIVVISGIWKEVGWGTIIYLAALAGINPHLYEAAVVDGANKWKQTIYITLPSLMPTILVLFLLRIGNFLELGFDQVFNLLTPMTYSVGDIIETYVYRAGVLQAQYSVTTAIGLFQSVIGFLLLWIFNRLARKSEQGLW